MIIQPDYVIERIHKDAYDNAYREAEKLRMLRQAGLIKPGKLQLGFCRGVACVGHVLVMLGRRMERMDPSASRARMALESM